MWVCSISLSILLCLDLHDFGKIVLHVIITYFLAYVIFLVQFMSKKIMNLNQQAGKAENYEYRDQWFESQVRPQSHLH